MPADGPALFERGRLNPGYLKLDLFCRGLRLGVRCRLDGRQEKLRVRAGLGSGLEMRIDGTDMHVNVPVAEEFTVDSPYELRGPGPDGRHVIVRDDEEVAHVRLPARPKYYARCTASGKLMESVGSIQGTYLGIYYGQLCANWKRPDADACRFCAVGLNVSEGGDRTDKRPADVVEVARAAREELGITFVHVNGGFDDTQRYYERFAPVIDALRKQTGLLIGLQLPPLPDLAQYHAFRELGVNNVSLCFETWDPRRFATVCPGKDARAGLERFKEAIYHCAEVERFDTTNGELIVGLEDPSNSMAAVDWLTSVGAIPTICVFRPVIGTHYEDLAPPRTDEVAPVFAHAYRRCMERGLPIGIAPNLRVSIVMNPEECRWLLPPRERGGWRMRRLRNRAMQAALGLYVKRRVKAAGAAS